jgi:hypothetical protein
MCLFGDTKIIFFAGNTAQQVWKVLRNALREIKKLNHLPVWKGGPIQV